MIIPSNSDVNTICLYCRCYWHQMVLPLVKSGQLYYHLKLRVTFFTVQDIFLAGWAGLQLKKVEYGSSSKLFADLTQSLWIVIRSQESTSEYTKTRFGHNYNIVNIKYPWQSRTTCWVDFFKGRNSIFRLEALPQSRIHSTDFQQFAISCY